MNRITAKFKELKAARKKAFIPFITAGDPSLEMTEEFVLAFDECGADIVELGVPFSDPIADGHTIQKASLRALNNGVNLNKVFRLVQSIRRHSQIPLVLMIYYNLIFKYGPKRFIQEASFAGVDGVIVPDLVPEEAGELIEFSKESGIGTIFLAAPTSPDERIRIISNVSNPFIYYVSVMGITGARRKLPAELEKNLKHIRQVLHSVKRESPVCVGFGISTPQQVREVSRLADGIIVGSAIVRKIEENLKAKYLLKDVISFVERLIKCR